MHGRFALAGLVGGLISIAAVLVSTTSANSTGVNLTFLPITVHTVPFDSDPPLDVYLGMVSATLDGDSDYYTVRVDGSNLTPITDNDVDDNLGSWSPDGAWLAYNNEAGTHLTNLQTGQVRTLGAIPYNLAQWSPNGRYFWWHQTETATVSLYDLHRDLITTFTANSVITDFPRWSSDSRYMAYAAAGTLWVVPTHNPIAHTLGTYERLRMEWSSTGKFLAFHSGPQGGETTYKWDATTDEITTIAEGYAFVAWFNHDQQVLLGHYDELYISTTDGTAIKLLSVQVQTNKVWVSPTTTRVLFQAPHTYVLFDAETSGATRVENRCYTGISCDEQYVWSADGRYLFGIYEEIYRNGAAYYNWIVDADATPPVFRYELSVPHRTLPRLLPFSHRYIQFYPLFDLETGEGIPIPLPESAGTPFAWRYLP